MKTEVYSWRVSTELKTGLEREARRRKTSLGAVLDLAARDWLTRGGAETDTEEEQLRIHRAASRCFGTIASGNAGRSENVRESVRERLRRRHGR
jgi:hypothetical protein